MTTASIDRLVDKIMDKISQNHPKALVVGSPPPDLLGYDPVGYPPYDAVVIGSLTLGELLHFSHTATLEALVLGKPVYLWEPGLPHFSGGNRHLTAKFQSAVQQLQQFGIQFYGGVWGGKLVTEALARQLVVQGKSPPPGAILTPMARDILGGLPS